MKSKSVPKTLPSVWIIWDVQWLKGNIYFQNMEYKCEQLNPNERSQAYTCVVPGGRRDVREESYQFTGRPERKVDRTWLEDLTGARQLGHWLSSCPYSYNVYFVSLVLRGNGHDLYHTSSNFVNSSNYFKRLVAHRIRHHFFQPDWSSSRHPTSQPMSH